MKYYYVIFLTIASIFFMQSFSSLFKRTQGDEEKFTRRIIATDLADPWELVYGPDDYLWITESKSYKISKINPTTGNKKVLLDLNDQRLFPRYDKIKADGKPWPQGGLMGMALHPEFLTDKPYVYVAFIYKFKGADKDGDGCELDLKGCYFKTKTVRYRYDKQQDTLLNAQVIDDNIPGSNDHNGGRLLVAPVKGKNFLFYSIGDLGAGQFNNGGRPNHAQNNQVKEGKILRYNVEPDEDGDLRDQWVPNDNPFNDERQVAVYSIGHRNPQGLCYAVIKQQTLIYSCEHGPFSDDEINLIQGGKNYGHPLIIGYNDGNYNGLAAAAADKKQLPGKWHTTYPLIISEQKQAAKLGPDFRGPLYSFEAFSNKYLTEVMEQALASESSEWKSVAPSSIEVYTSDGIPNWKNSLLITSLKGGQVFRLKLSANGRKVVGKPHSYFKGKLRYRDLARSPDGKKIYLITDKSAVTSGPTEENPEENNLRGCLLEFTFHQPFRF